MQNQKLQQDRYQITKLFGQGKVVSYFEALDNKSGQRVLLKKIAADAAFNPDSVALFNAEALFLERITHEGFLRVLDHFNEAGGYFLVMESVDGKNIGDLLKKSDEVFALPDVINWCEQTLEALSYIHTLPEPILFYSLKPQFLHVTSHGKIKLLTTGISVPGNLHAGSVVFDSANISYSALELIWQKLDAGTRRVILNDYDERSEHILLLPPDRRTDLYALGTIIYQLLTGHPAVDALERSIDILEDRPDPLIAPSKINPEISPEIESFVLKALEIRRENRFSNALEMRAEAAAAFKAHRERKAEMLRIEATKAPDLRAYREKVAAGELKITSRRQETEPVDLRVSAETFRQKPKFVDEPVIRTPEETTVLPIVEKEEPRSLPSETANISEVDAEEWQEEFETAWEMSEESEAGGEFSYLLGENRKKRNPLLKFAAAFGALALVGAGAFGALQMTSTASTIAPQAVAAPVVDAPQTLPVPAAASEPESAPTAEPQNYSTVSAPEQQVEPENKKETTAKAVRAAEVKKTEAPKSAADEKKKVSVDDLINDKPKKKVTVDDLIKID